MKARQVFHDKQRWPEGTITELVVWELPVPVSGSTHRFKYRLFFGTDGQRWIGYDNERGKGDHTHIGEAEEPYRFTAPDELIRDFWADVDRWREARTDNDGSSRRRR
jgi:hypothetical protein